MGLQNLQPLLSGIIVTAPNRDSSWQIDTEQTIEATVQVSGLFDIELSRNGGGTWESITTNEADTAGAISFAWTVTGATSSQCLIRITDTVTGVQGVSDLFTIAQAVVSGLLVHALSGLSGLSGGGRIGA